MQSKQALRSRIRSVKSTRKITSAMEMIANAKLFKQRAAMEANREYAMRLRQTINEIIARNPGIDSPYMKHSDDGKKVTIGGMTKGAGIIAPHMFPAVPHATMLCFITTDAAAENADLTHFLTDAVDVSFNRITVDNDMSTNDTCMLLANGESGAKVAYDGSEGARLFASALRHVVQTLAKGMVMDGEGSSKFVEVVVTGAKDAAQAHICAKAIADSMLCKTAWFGCDPNWGRILAAAGYSGAQFSPENVSLDYDDKPVVRGGMDAGTPEAELSELMKTGSFTVHIDLGAGVASDVMWTSDITYDYVKINADYHT